MAVTAPTYVLEESLSSQKLWKQTAGNRPPQPVEERHFFEQMWAQNFTRSKVKYEIPVEVLTASTPISISPFNDDGFCDDDRDAPGNNLSNYNLAAPFGMKDDGPADSAYVKAAQADVAEARSTSTSATAPSRCTSTRTGRRTTTSTTSGRTTTSTTS